MADSTIKRNPANNMNRMGEDFHSPAIIEQVEQSFLAASNYSLFSGATGTAEEAGWYGFKHNNNRASFAILFGAIGASGCSLLMRDASGNWSCKILWGGGVLNLISSLLRLKARGCAA